MRDLMVSAGKKRKLYDMPAEAPATACCQRGSGANSTAMEEEVDGVIERLFQRWKSSVAVSFEPNQAAQPPVSRIRVPS